MNRVQTVLSRFLRKACPSVVLWLSENIKIPRSMSPRSPGRFSISDRPYQGPVLEEFHPESGTTDLTLAGGTQIFKTFMLLMGGAYRMVHEPLPVLFAVPSIDFAKKKIVARKLHPLINENAVLAALKPDNPDNFTLTEMQMRDCEWTLSGTGSANNLSSITAGMVLMDECGKIVGFGGEDAEAHPMRLADERTKDFGDLAFRAKASSPTSDSHPFWASFELGSQTSPYVPCPNCPEFFTFEFKREEDGYKSLIWSPDAKDRDGRWIKERVIESARYVCPSCGYKIRSEERPDMIRAFAMKDHNPSAARSHRSYLINSFFAPSIPFGSIAWQFLVELQEFNLQNFYNSWLALPWAEIAVKLGKEDVRKLVNPEYRRGTIPKMPQSLVITADPGETSGTHWMVGALMDDGDIYVIEWGKTLGIPDLAKHPQLAAYPLLGSKKWLAPAAGLTDSKYNSDEVYALCARSRGFWRPTRGSDAAFGHWQATPVASHPGMMHFVFVDHSLKTELYSRRIAHGGPPRIHLPADADEMLLGQLTGQQLDARTGKWKRLQHDHLGDCLKQLVLQQWIGRSVANTVYRAAA